MFNERFARRAAARYRRRGLDPTARRLHELLRGRGATVLEIGGGVGELEIELLHAGASRATNLELSHAYEREGRKLVDEAGLSGRLDWRYGDLAADASLVEGAEVVVMHRVVCCYPDMPGLVAAAAAKTGRALALSFPRNRRLVRVGARVVNAWFRLRRSDFRFYVHAPEAIVRVARQQGLEPFAAEPGRIWQVAAFERG